MKEVCNYSYFADGETWHIEQLNSLLKVTWDQMDLIYTRSATCKLAPTDLFYSLHLNCAHLNNAVAKSICFLQSL